jgi:hypothetical protein
MLAEIERANRWPAKDQVKDLAVLPAEGAALAGTYKLPAAAGGKTVVSLEQGKLVMTDRKGKNHRLLLQGARLYIVEDVKATLTFAPASGPATTLTLTHGQFQITGTREER